MGMPAQATPKDEDCGANVACTKVCEMPHIKKPQGGKALAVSDCLRGKQGINAC